MMTRHEPIRLLYLTAEQWPTFRPDLVALFGKYLPRLGILSDLLTEREIGHSTKGLLWGGSMFLCDVPSSRAMQYVIKFMHQLKGLINLAGYYDAVQVRDMPYIAVFALLIAKIKGKPFFYWMSFPQSEGQVQRALSRSWRAGLKYWFPLIQGSIGQIVLYKIVMPFSDHIFLQSKRMVEDMAAHKIPFSKMTAVPMGVDLEITQSEKITPSDDPRLQNRRVVIYLGTLDRARKIETVFKAIRIVKLVCPEILLILAGDTEDEDHRKWLSSEIEKLGLAENIIWTGWLPAIEAWRFVRAAEVGLSTFPRNKLLDSASPTKAVEYMALGIPVIGNDNPDQATVITESAAGLCVPLKPYAYASAILQLLSNASLRNEMAQAGPLYVKQQRGYDRIAMDVADTYQRLLLRAPSLNI